jgi:hypothetical protein
MTNLHTTTIAAAEPETVAELTAYRAAAARGDVLPACMRLTTARAEGEWRYRLELARAVGPACPETTLDLACSFMPDAPEPRLFRAARSIAIAERSACPRTRDSWRGFAQRDLVDVLRLDARDATARALLRELSFTTDGSFDLAA